MKPRRVAYAVAQLGLAHAVITSVNRDDDNLGAAQAFVSVIREIRAQAPACRVEVLTPDFQGNEAALRLVVAARPDILNHNIETVPRLYRVAKSGGRYERSLRFLEQAKEIAAESSETLVTKTGIIVGMGEEMHELLARLPRLSRPQGRHPHHRPIPPPQPRPPGHGPLLHARRVRLPQA